MGEVQSLERFISRAEAVDAHVVRVRNVLEALEYAVALTLEQSGKAIAAPGLSEALQAELGRLCEKNHLALYTSGLRSCEGFHLGLTLGQWAIAETGTVVIDSRDEDVRLASMLAETHVVLLDPAFVRADINALREEIGDLLSAPPGYMAFITGPSRTADIEMVLTLGAHGPRALHILLIPAPDPLEAKDPSGKE